LKIEFKDGTILQPLDASYWGGRPSLPSQQRLLKLGKATGLGGYHRFKDNK